MKDIKLLSKNKYLKVSLLLSGGGDVPEWRKHLQPCEWLESDGNCYIDLKVNFSAYSSFEIKYSKSIEQGGGIMGCRNSVYNKNFAIQHIADERTRITVFSGGNQQQLSENQIYINSNYNNIIVFYENKNILVKDFDNNILNKGSFITEDFTTDYNVFLFAINDAGNAQLSQNGTKLYNLRYNNNNYIAAYVIDEYEDLKGNLCVAGTSGVVDILNGTFYTNDGSGLFSHGGDI